MKDENDGQNRRESQSKKEYTDAQYTTNSTGPSPSEPLYVYVKPRRVKSPRIAMSWMLILCFSCTLAGGMGGIIGVRYFTPTDEPTIAVVNPYADTEQNPGITGVVSGADSVQWEASPLYTGRELSGADTYELGCPQVVGITTEVSTTNRFGTVSATSVTGTGFVVRPDGYVVTNYHVIETALTRGLEIVVMLYDGENCVAQIVGYEKDNDIAVLKIDADGLSAVVIGDSSAMRVGDRVYTIGNPLGELTYTMTSGILSAFDRIISTDDSMRINMFQFDAAVNSGNSGGPVFNNRGEAVGIVTAKYSSNDSFSYGDAKIEGLGFAIPMNDAVRIMNELIEKGYVSGKASVDIEVRNMDAVTAQYYNLPVGAYVYTVVPGGAAEMAGIMSGDIITGLGERKVTSISDLLEFKRKYSAGDTVVITVYRKGEEMNIELTFSEEIRAIIPENSERATGS